MWWWVLTRPGVTRQPSARRIRAACGGRSAGPPTAVTSPSVHGDPAAGDLTAFVVHRRHQLGARDEQVDGPVRCRIRRSGRRSVAHRFGWVVGHAATLRRGPARRRRAGRDVLVNSGPGGPVRSAPMRIDEVELRVVALPLRSPFASAHGTVTTRTVVVCRLAGPDGEGWGECAALPEPTYTAEYTDGALAALRDHLVPRLLEAAAVESTGLTAAQVAAALDDVVGHPMAKAALELAVLDAEGRAAGTPWPAGSPPTLPGPPPPCRPASRWGCWPRPGRSRPRWPPAWPRATAASS